MISFNSRLAIRNYIKNKEYSLINIIGLALGLSAFILIFLVIQYHRSFDSYNKNFKNIYRIDLRMNISGATESIQSCPFKLGQILQHDYPEFITTTRVMSCYEFLSSSKDLTFFESQGMYSDSTLFKIFDFAFLEGNPSVALKDSNSIVLTEELARKYFPGMNAFGKTIIFQDSFRCKVTGIIKNLPANSTFRPHYLIAFSMLRRTIQPGIEDKWDWLMSSTFALIKPGTNIQALNNKIANSLYRYTKLHKGSKVFLWPFANIHLRFREEIDNRGFIHLLEIIAFFIILIAGINFMNLATAYSSVRVREIGLRKLAGASRYSIIFQFLGESIFISIIALILALALAEATLPYLNSLLDIDLKFNYFKNFQFYSLTLGIAILTGILSETYLAFYLSSLLPEQALKGSTRTSTSSPFLRKSLVVFQYVISITLIILTIIIIRQLQFVQNKDMGFNKENILVGNIKLVDPNNETKYQALRNELLKDSIVENMSWSHNVPFYFAEWWAVSVEGKPFDQKYKTNHNHVDFNFVKTFGIQIKQGHELSDKCNTNKTKECLVNERAIEVYGWGQNAIGKHIYNDGINYTVIGVMKNFHYYSVLAPIEPYFLSYSTRELSWPNVHALKIARNRNANKMKSIITKKFREYFPNSNIEFSFLEEYFKRDNYYFIEMLCAIIGIFAFLAVCISSIGLFGLVSLITKQRTKEIGIRKANGASSIDTVKLLTREFLGVFIIANIIAWPMSYYIARELLKNFAYHVDIEISVFLITGAFSLVVTMLTMLIHIYRASIANPIDALRYD